MNNTNPAQSITGIVAAVCLAACAPAPAPAPQTTAPAPMPSGPAAASTTAPVGADYPLARDACLAAVAKQANVPQDKLVATEVLWAEAGVGVTVQVPDADAPWSCLSDEKGNVQGAAYTGSEGKL
jgi:hypothetical protein